LFSAYDITLGPRPLSPLDLLYHGANFKFYSVWSTTALDVELPCCKWWRLTPVQNFMSPVSSIQSFFVLCQWRYMLKTGLSFQDSGLETGVWWRHTRTQTASAARHSISWREFQISISLVNQGFGFGAPSRMRTAANIPVNQHCIEISVKNSSLLYRGLQVKKSHPSKGCLYRLFDRHFSTIFLFISSYFKLVHTPPLKYIHIYIYYYLYKSADPPKFEAKSTVRQWSFLNLDPLKALLMKSQSRIENE
jgi:hypothetical protein